MDTARAQQLLNISPPYHDKELKKAYYRAALRHHPDKNQGTENAQKFLDVTEAYTFLSMTYEQPPDESYENVLKRFMELCTKLDGTEIAHVLELSCRKLSVDAMRKLDRKTAVTIYGYLEKYAPFFRFDTDILNELREVVEENTEFYLIRPTLQNLLQSDIYKLECTNETYYIPMWHDELTYDNVVVKCVPDLPEHIYIDERNSLHVTVRTSIERVLQNGGLELTVGNKALFIKSDDLRIVGQQTHVIKSAGIPQINARDVYDNRTRGDIIVRVEFT